MPQATTLTNPAAAAVMVGLTPQEQKHLLRYLNGSRIGQGGRRIPREAIANAVEASIGQLEEDVLRIRGQIGSMRGWLLRYQAEKRRRS
jgi:hypothetical protein